MPEENEFLGIIQLFNQNSHITVPADVRRKLKIFNKGKFKFLWLFDRSKKQVYVKVSRPPIDSYDITLWPSRLVN